MLKPLFDQLLPTIEALTVTQLASKAEKGRLPGDLVNEIEKDAKWSTPAKKALELSAPQVAAKFLNKTGISSENQPEVICGTAIASILAGHVMVLRRIDKAIASMNAAKPAPAPAKEEKKP